MKRFLVTVILALITIGAYISWDVYRRVFSPNVDLADSSVEFLIFSDWTYADVERALSDQGVIKDSLSFRWVSEKKNYPNLIKPGRYIILDGMNNNQLVNLLRSGEQDPIDLVLNSVRTKERLAGSVSMYIEADSLSILSALNDEAIAAHYGFNLETVITMFIPNTYEFYWSTTTEEFLVRMAKEYKRFWTEDRLAKARAMGLSQSDVSILASIVQAEQGAHPDERPAVAGLYLNRLKRGMRLESDPTLIHAIGDYSIKRVLKVHKEIESPYNTYKYAGLPPGPIMLPEIPSIDAVLNPQEHNYIFMCAKEDFSGYHNFSSSYRDHINNARRYQNELNKRRIYK